MVIRKYNHPTRPGRPAGPTEGRGMKPYDPRWGTTKRRQIIEAVHREREALKRGELTLSQLARNIGTCLSYLSITKNSPWGQHQLRLLAEASQRAMSGPDEK